MWKTKPVSHISTPPTATTDKDQKRVFLVSVPYALKAGDAATIGGTPAIGFCAGGAGRGPATSALAADSSPYPCRVIVPEDGGAEFGVELA